MRRKNASLIQYSLVIALICIGSFGCQAQNKVFTPTLNSTSFVITPTLPSPTVMLPSLTAILTSTTPLPPTAAPPTRVPTSTSEPAVQVQVLPDIVGDWKGKCGGNLCLWNFGSDGVYYVADYFQGNMGVIFERGKITASTGIFHFKSSDVCGNILDANGYYQASLTKLEGKAYMLEFKSTQSDECADRENSLNLPLMAVNP